MPSSYNTDLHHRRTIRLKRYDYAQAGAYFVTICTKDRECWFGKIVHGEMQLNDAGRMVQSIWEELPKHYSGVNIDGFIVMPNHIHGIIVLIPVGAGPRACPDKGRACPDKGQPQGVAPTISLPDVIHRFKSLTTTRYREGVQKYGWRPFPGKLWQRNYYEHIIRNDGDMNHIREYIENNPVKWADDENNPVKIEKVH